MKYNNKYLVIVALGALATIPCEIISKILVFLGIGQYPVYELNSLLVLSDQPNFLIGLFINFIVGGLLAVMLYLVIDKWWDTNLVILKCILGSWVSWFIYELVFTAMIEGHTIPTRPTIDHVVHIIATTAYGCTLGILLKRYIFKKTV